MNQEQPGAEFELKTIREDSVNEAITKAERYRLLNEPPQAESIMLDVLAIDAQNQKALVVLILAMSDRFATNDSSRSVQQILDYCERLDDEYQRLYYSGIVYEREARSLLEKGKSSVFVYDGLRRAMDFFERAEARRPAGNDDAILRWNCCVRTIRERKLRPLPQERQFLLE